MFFKIPIIIVNYNGKIYLIDCLASIFKQTYPNFEVILVDNGSSDDSIEFVRNNFPMIKIISLNKNYGFARANNLGIEEALKDEAVKYIALLNNDTKIDTCWLEELIKVAEQDKLIGSCQSKILFLDKPNKFDAIGISIQRNGVALQIAHNLEDCGQYNEVKKVFGACAGATLYRREMLEEIGLFDEDFFAYYEDVDLALRARLFEWKCMYVPKAIVYHKHSATLGNKSPYKRYLLERNRYYYIIKNFPIRNIIEFFAKRPLVIIILILKSLKNKEFNIIKSILQGNFDGIKDILKFFKKRKENISFMFNFRGK
ncbi:MAG: glycosyltransferase family 2 protein [Armatimonadetes bacterium]|nr:glycosyltransferase family 2 protein [Armatimonadota bacterium]